MEFLATRRQWRALQAAHDYPLTARVGRPRRRPFFHCRLTSRYPAAPVANQRAAGVGHAAYVRSDAIDDGALSTGEFSVAGRSIAGALDRLCAPMQAFELFRAPSRKRQICSWPVYSRWLL